MEKFIIAIPSYQRAEKQATVDYLHGLGVPRERIYIFVQTAKDKEAYAQHEEKANIVLAAADGIAKARNNILRHFAGSRNILMMDDDISSIGKLKGKDIQAIESREEFADTFNRCFGMALKRGVAVWGIYPVHNAFFMSPTISTAVTVNTVVGFTKGQPHEFDDSFKAKEDIELCARILAAGGEVLRYNFLAMNAKHRTNAGGCHDAWHSNANRVAVERLCKMYPEILAPNSRKPDEVRVIAKDTNKINLRRGGKTSGNSGSKN